MLNPPDMADESQKTIRVLFIAAEADPLVKIGGLGDYAGSLPGAILRIAKPEKKNIDIRVALPFHKKIEEFAKNPGKILDVTVPTNHGHASGMVYEYSHEGIIYYLIKRAGNPDGYADVYNSSQIADARKYIFFSLSALEMLRHINWKTDILHANDWHTALAVYQLSNLRKKDQIFKQIKSLLVIHNVPFLGEGSQKIMRDFLIPPASSPHLPEWAEYLPLTLGLQSADQLVTVSPSYAKELKTEEFGDGLADFFIANKEKLTGILNGIDYRTWNPDDDPYIFSRFTPSSLDRRIENKYDLLSSVGLENRMDFPLIVMVSRLTYQKGIDIILRSLHELKDIEWTAIFLGSGDESYERDLKNLEGIMSKRLRVFLSYNASFAHTLYAGGDMFLMPSLYEPCGISQMIAMRYACIPVANAVGGLKDTITHAPQENKTGYLFDGRVEDAFGKCMVEAFSDFSDKNKWKDIQQRAMTRDFSWNHSAREYIRLYYRLLTNG